LIDSLTLYFVRALTRPKLRFDVLHRGERNADGLKQFLPGFLLSTIRFTWARIASVIFARFPAGFTGRKLGGTRFAASPFA